MPGYRRHDANRAPALVARSCLYGIGAVWILALAALLAAPAGASGPQKRSPKLATEVCEEMVQEAIEAVAGAPLAAAPVGEWIVPKQQYVCTYVLDGAPLTMTVDVGKTIKVAKSEFSKARSAAEARETLHGIGQQAFQTPDGTLIARKDNFVLRVDPTAIPDRVQRRDLAFAASLAVMSCWPG